SPNGRSLGSPTAPGRKSLGEVRCVAFRCNSMIEDGRAHMSVFVALYGGRFADRSRTVGRGERVVLDADPEPAVYRVRLPLLECERRRHPTEYVVVQSVETLVDLCRGDGPAAASIGRLNSVGQQQTGDPVLDRFLVVVRVGQGLG